MKDNLKPAGSLLTRKYLHIILPTFVGSVIAYFDRVNIAFAALTMNADLGFSAQGFGMGIVKDMTGSFLWAYFYLACSLAAAIAFMLTLKKKAPA